MLSCNEGRRKNHGCRCNNNSPRYMRETVSLSFASVVKISYVFITKDEHTFFYVRRITFRPHSANIALYSDCGKFSAIYIRFAALPISRPLCITTSMVVFKSRLQVVEAVDLVVEGVLGPGDLIEQHLLLAQHGRVNRGRGERDERAPHLRQHLQLEVKPTLRSFQHLVEFLQVMSILYPELLQIGAVLYRQRHQFLAALH